MGIEEENGWIMKKKGRMAKERRKGKESKQEKKKKEEEKKIIRIKSCLAKKTTCS